MLAASSSFSLPFFSSVPENLFISRVNRTSPAHSSGKFILIQCAAKSRRTGKLRYSSEKKKLKEIQKTKVVKDKFNGIWRLSKLGVEVHNDPGKDFLGISEALLEQIAKVFEFPVPSMLLEEAFVVVRKSFDARKLLKEPKFVYTVDMDVNKILSLEPRMWDFISELEPQVGTVEHMPLGNLSYDLIGMLYDCKKNIQNSMLEQGGDTMLSDGTRKLPSRNKPKVAVVGSGPSGLFSSLVLAELGADVTLIERGQPVEQRGRDIGALIVRRILQLESNYCFGEGGAGTWSDGKLVTRIGKNSAGVQATWNT